MNEVIGYKYLENLMKIKGLVRDLLCGGFQETQRVFILSEIGGRCYYNDCFDKKVRSDKKLIIASDEDRRVDVYPFHSKCIDSLLKDERIPGIN